MGQQPQQEPASLNVNSLYAMGNNDPLGLGGGYWLPENTPHMDFNEEMEKIRAEAKLVRQESDRQFADQSNSFSAKFDFDGAPVHAMRIELCRRPTRADVEEDERYLERLERD
jgi:hypothetical protein